MLRRNLAFAMLLTMSATVWTGCGSATNTGSEKNEPMTNTPEEPPKPVTLTVLSGNGLTDSEFQMLYVDPVKKKYPYITVVKAASKTTAELVAAGETPDLISNNNGNFGLYQELDLLFDMSELAKKHKLDMSRFDPVVLQAMAVTSPTALNAIPYALNFAALYYNKDHFDTFGVAYPKDGLTWDQAIDIGKKMSRKLGDIQIRGLDPYAYGRFQRVLGNTFYDTNTNKSTLDTPEWKFIFEHTKEILTIPGNEWTDGEIKSAISPATNFRDKRISAMYAGNNMTSLLEQPTKDGLNWDVAQYPSLPQKPNIYGDIDAHLTFVTKPSKHKEEAFKVLVELASDELQMELVRKTARKSPLADKKFESGFGAELEFAKGKNLLGPFKSKASNSPVKPKYATQATNFMNAAFYDYYHGKDINSALREADEKMNLFLAGNPPNK